MHCVSVYLVKKSDLRDRKIENILENRDDIGDKIIWTEMNCGVLATKSKIPEDFMKGKMIAKINTDYFGGYGHQGAKLFINGDLEYEANDEQDYTIRPINTVLKKMGVVKKDCMDEFDTIGLGKYRNNDDFNWRI